MSAARLAHHEAELARRQALRRDLVDRLSQVTSDWLELRRELQALGRGSHVGVLSMSVHEYRAEAASHAARERDLSAAIGQALERREALKTELDAATAAVGRVSDLVDNLMRYARDAT